MTILHDSYGRKIDSLRISVTQKCNFNCFFCHQEGEHDSGKEMTPEEIKNIVFAAAEFGINKIKITGGEPLIRNDIVEIISKIAPYVNEVSMTTNAFFLNEKAYDLQRAGLMRVNISLHSIKPDNYKKITGIDAFSKVEEGIKTAQMCGLNPIKLNMVIMNGINDSEISGALNFAVKYNAVLQVIEYQPLERGMDDWNKYYYDLTPLEDTWSRQATNIIEREMHHRKQYTLPNGAVVEVVRPMHNSVFCSNCNRLRISSDGYLKPCLMRDDNLVPIVKLIRVGASKSQIKEAFLEATKRRAPYWRQ